MGSWQRGWTVVLVISMYSQAAIAEEKPITFGDEPGLKLQRDEDAESRIDQHHRSRRQLLDGWSPLRDTLSTLENVDDLLRTTVPEVDQLNCLERFMCEMSSGSIMNGINEFMNPTTPIPHLPLPQPSAQFPNFHAQNPAHQQGFQQFQQPHAQPHPSQFAQHPQHGFPQQGHPQSIPQQGFQQPPQHAFPPQGHPQSIPQQGFQQPPQHAFPPQGHPQSIPQQGFQQPAQQGFPPQGHPQSIPQQGFQQPAQQGFPPQGHPQSIPQQGFQHRPAFQNHIDPNQVQQAFDPTFQQGGFVNNPGFQQFPTTHHSQQAPGQHFSQFRESSGDDNNIRREGESQPIARPLRRRKNPTRSGIMGLIDNLFGSRNKRSITPVEKENSEEDSIILSRKERSIMDSLLSTFNAFSPDILLRMVDQYMVGQQNSLYPYSHAAIMGYTGSGQRCERMYPKCPTTPDQMIHVFNNIRRYYPEGMPFADQLPWPLRDLFK